MTRVAICSGKGSPGVSTLACVAGAVWPHGRRIVIAECDPSGNDLAARFGMSPRLGMTSLVLAHRHSEDSEATFDAHVQRLPGGLEALVGPVNPDAATSLDRELSSAGLAIFPGPVDILVDCGQILSGAPGQRAILKAADQVVVVTRPDAAGLAHAQWTLDVVRNLATRGTTSFVVVGPGDFSVGEIERAFPSSFLGAIALDRRSAAMACGTPGHPRRFARSSLVASARRLVDRLLNQADTEAETGGFTRSTGSDGVDAASNRSPSVVSRLELATQGDLGARAR